MSKRDELEIRSGNKDYAKKISLGFIGRVVRTAKKSRRFWSQILKDFKISKILEPRSPQETL